MIADTAEGRFFAVTDPSELPRILVAESKAARSENVQQGVVNLVPNIASHPVLLGISPVNLPALFAYNAVSSRTSLGAEDILVSANFQDPVLSAWGYGLGRVIAWMGDSGDEWARGWPAETQFWGQVARYALPDPSISSTQATLTPQGDIFAIELQARSPEGVPINFAAPEFSYVDENGQIRSFALTQIAPGVYQTEIKVPPAGAYRGLISFIGQQGYQEIAAPFAIPVSPELFPVDQEEAAATISRWQNAGEAELIGFEDLMVTEDLETPKASFDLRAWLVGGLIVYWVLEIAARRRWLPWN
jgi:hypothetical protein